MNFTVIGVIHLLPLVGSPKYNGDMKEVLDRALSDLDALVNGGVDGVIVENFNDVPFFKDSIPSETLAAFVSVAVKIKENLPHHLLFGVNVLRNDALSALLIAYAVSADFIRINVPVGAVITPSGIIEGKIAEVARKRKLLNAEHIAFYEDVMVKHAWQFDDYSIEDWAIETEKRGLADVIIVSGKRTGDVTSCDTVKRVKSVVNVPVFVGSGVNIDNVRKFIGVADGAIVGTYFEEGGRSGAPVKVERVKSFVETVKSFL